MRIMLIGGDNYLGTTIEKINVWGEAVTVLFQNDFEPLKIISNFLTEHPSILIIDDDYLYPNTVSVLNAICMLNKKTRIIFTTSSTSIELGKQVCQLGIYYYAIKPINENEIIELLSSIFENSKKYNSH